MPQLSNERAEIYAKMRAKGMIPSKAAISAGYSPGSAVYTGLENDPEILQRVRELIDLLEEQREHRRSAALEAAKAVGEVTGTDKAWVVQKLAENAQLAADSGMFKESNEALQLIGKEFGMFRGESGTEANVERIVPRIDLEKLQEALSQRKEILPAPSSVVSPEEALALIEGQGSSQHHLKKHRQIVDSSETGIAFRPESDFDDDE